MGKAFGYLIFGACFLVFVLVKFVFTGAKAAYEAVFDPNAKDERIRQLISLCMLRVSHAMHERYAGDETMLPFAIARLTPLVQSMILEAGYNAPASIAQVIVCDAIIAGNHASREQVENALKEV